jgi:hypothetical protein
MYILYTHKSKHEHLAGLLMLNMRWLDFLVMWGRDGSERMASTTPIRRVPLGDDVTARLRELHAEVHLKLGCGGRVAGTKPFKYKAAGGLRSVSL